MAEGFVAFVHWPAAPLTDSLVRKALSTIHTTPVLLDLPVANGKKLLQWASYDSIEHDLTLSNQTDVLSSSYIIRKALIRKHFLSRCIHAYLLKHPESPLRNAVPQTWDLEISFADELDDMWADELWGLGKDMDDSEAEGRGKWWILKPGMADRGMGIRLFNSKDALQRIFERFEEDESDASDAEDSEATPVKDDTAVVTSQLRHFVIQEYIISPLLLDPYQFPVNGGPSKQLEDLQGYKFHLRAYCVASGALKLYLYTRILALFSSEPYGVPKARDEDEPSALSLAPHLTNTSLQTHRGEEGVRLLGELIGCHILSDDGQSDNLQLTAEHLTDIQNQMTEVLAETFRAALGTAIHFQALPNAFELYGIDFLVCHTPSATSSPQFQVKLLEVNAEPAIELTGPRLTYILEDLFKATATVCVEPFFQEAGEASDEPWPVGETRHHLRKCLEAEVRGAGGW